jgi:hypothetical protein
MAYGTRLLRTAVIALVLITVGGTVHADVTVFSDSFDDGNWTADPKWEYAQTGPVTVSSERSTSPPCSLKVAANNQLGAIRAFSGLFSATETYTSAFNLYVESMGDEAIPWALISTGSVTVAIVFILPGGTVQLFVSDRADQWHGVSANVPYPLTYGEWHSFRITYDGLTTNLYLDGHTTPDASVSQAYIRAPAKVYIGNFSLPHTSTFYIDDLAFTSSNAPNPAPVYVQICSDTSTDGISTSGHYMSFSALDSSYTSPDGQAARVMDESYRFSHLDSLGNTIKFTWYMLTGSLYAYGINTGPLLPLELMIDYRGDQIERWGDELAYHYHTWIWSDPNGDEIFHWNQAPDFSDCQEDFEVTVARMMLDRNFYPSSFRSGWHYMDNYFQRYLDEWFPYRFENDYPNKRTEDVEPIDNVYDWSRAPSVWVPYHPDPNDYQSAGNLRGWDSRSRYMPALNASQVEDAFLQALGGTTQVMTLFSHLKESNFPEQVTSTHNLLTSTHEMLPLVEFEYLTGRECMLKWRNGSDVTPPNVSIATSDNGGVRMATITVDEEIYQLQPFVAYATTSGLYGQLPCIQTGPNQWSVQYDPANTLKIAVAVTDWFGNPRVQFVRSPLKIYDLKTSVSTNSAEITWETNNPADTRLDYQIAPYGGVTSVYAGERVLPHKVSLTGLVPGSVYKINLSAEDEFGQNAVSDDLYILTKLSEPCVIDNLDPGFSTVGSWSTGSTAAGRYGTDYRWASTSPTGTSYAYWTWQVPSTGAYKICAWWSSGGNRSTEAKYAVLYQGSEYLKTVNQQADGGQWNLLGVYDLAAGETVLVRLSNIAPSGYVVIADAVRFEAAYVPLSSLGLARLLPDDESIEVSNVAVTAVFGTEFYIEELDRAAGMKVQGLGVSPGEVVTICGETSTIASERVVVNPVIEKPGDTATIEPLGTAGRDISLGSDQRLTNAGLLVTVWGKVKSVGTGYFYLDDGSGLADGTESPGIRIDASSLSSVPDVGDPAVVTGILAAQVVDTLTVPLLRPRNADDFVFP